jgi:hypothetical protein
MLVTALIKPTYVLGVNEEPLATITDWPCGPFRL